jgi:phosphomannomutase
MKNILLFDVDGTLTESSQKISKKMKYKLSQLKEKGFEIGIVGGGRYEKILYQLDGLQMNHVFAESGCVYYKGNDLVYKKNIRQHYLYHKINLIIKKALLYLSQVNYEITGHFIDLRNGIIYISLIGMDATLEEREAFLKLDKVHHFKVQLLRILQKMTNDLGIQNDLVVLEGGSVGIGIYPKEWDKTQVLESLDSLEYNTIHYFGDKYKIDGNDYNILHHPRVIGQPINNPEECLEILGKILQN